MGKLSKFKDYRHSLVLDIHISYATVCVYIRVFIKEKGFSSLSGFFLKDYRNLPSFPNSLRVATIYQRGTNHMGGNYFSIFNLLVFVQLAVMENDNSSSSG